MYRFDESDPANRSPQGALPQGQPLRLTLCYRRGFCRKAILMWKPDEGEAREQPMTWKETIGGDDVFSAQLLTPSTGLYWYWFRIETAEGTFVVDNEGPRDESLMPYQLTVYDAALKTPDWVKGGVMYHIFVDRFARGGAQARPMLPGTVLRSDWGATPTFLPDEKGIVHNNDFFGGNLEGVLSKLPYLQKQGITCLYLSPIFEAASNHKYDTGDYMRVDPGFGNESALRKLCEEAIARGMRVVLDGVFSHVGADSIYFNKYGNYQSLGAYQSKASPYYPWFTFRDWPESYASWWDIPLLPEIDKNEPTYREYIAGKGGVVEHWLDCGISGWRLDVVDELPDAFLDSLCSTIRRKRPDALIVGEVWEDASNKIAYGARRRYFLGGQLDSVMNYPLKDAIISYIRNQSAAIMADTMAILIQNYPKPVLDSLMNILGTHDTLRILTALGNESLPETKAEIASFRLSDEQRVYGKRMLRIASALQFMLPGFPCVYYGDEAGMEGGADPFNRVCYPWGAEDEELVDWYKRLAEIRRARPVFREGAYKLVIAREGVFAFKRGEGADTVLIAVNVGEEKFTFPMESFELDLIRNKPADACAVAGQSVAIYAKGRQGV
ncbi:MAG: alpha-amylase family glycosyl hydrolase [Clostridiales bacterium]|nr:alpha-amylase family glycosyl hydrolase [Clostridiales bacterium]